MSRIKSLGAGAFSFGAAALFPVELISIKRENLAKPPRKSNEFGYAKLARPTVYQEPKAVRLAEVDAA